MTGLGDDPTLFIVHNLYSGILIEMVHNNNTRAKLNIGAAVMRKKICLLKPLGKKLFKNPENINHFTVNFTLLDQKSRIGHSFLRFQIPSSISI